MRKIGIAIAIVGLVGGVPRMGLAQIVDPTSTFVPSAVHTSPSFTGAYALDGLRPVQVQEGSVVGQGIQLPGGLCATAGPLALGYTFDSTPTAATVAWEFNDSCQAVITEISASASSSGSVTNGISLCRSPHAANCLFNPGPETLAEEEEIYKMWVESRATDWLSNGTSRVRAEGYFSVGTTDDGTKTITVADEPTGGCEVFTSYPLTSTTDHCEFGDFYTTIVDEEDGSTVAGYGIEVHGTFAFGHAELAELTPLATYTLNGTAIVGADLEHYSYECSYSGTFPPGWANPCVSQAPMPK